MKRFEIFRSKDPQVSAWLQKNGFQNRYSNSYDENRGKTAQELEPDVQTKEVRFYMDEYMHSKIPSLVLKQTIPELRSNKTEAHGRGRLKTMDDIPVFGSSQTLKRVVCQEKTKGNRIRSFSTPPNNEFSLGYAAVTKGRASLDRRSSTFSLYSDRPSNIPVLIRNNNIRLRKYSCPEYYTTAGAQESDQREGRELDWKGFGRNAMNVSNSTSQQLAKESAINGQTATKLRERNVDKRRDAAVKTNFDLQTLQEENKYAKRRKDDPIRELNDSRLQVAPATDLNGNEISFNPRGPMSDGSLTDNDVEDLRFKVYEEDSLESYSLDVQPRRPLKQNFPSSMYSTRGTMLTWLGEVNRNNPQLLS